MLAGTSGVYVATRNVSVEMDVSISSSTLMLATAPERSAPERRSQSERVGAVRTEARRGELEGLTVLGRLPNGSRLSCGALKKDSFLNLRAPAASSAC